MISPLPNARRYRMVGLLGALLLALLPAACVPLRPAAQPEPGVRTANVRNAEITPLRAGNVLVLEIRSATGIGSADVVLEEDLQVRDIVLRFYLRGLENLTFAAPDGHVVTVAISSDEMMIVRQSLRAPGAAVETALAQGDPWWMPTGVISDDPAVPAQIPLANGHIDVTMAPAFLRSDARSFSLSWIDFYR